MARALAKHILCGLICGQPSGLHLLLLLPGAAQHAGGRCGTRAFLQVVSYTGLTMRTVALLLPGAAQHAGHRCVEHKSLGHRRCIFCVGICKHGHTGLHLQYLQAEIK
jgi:hypothetical protein